MRRLLVTMVVVAVMAIALPVSARDSVSGVATMDLHGRAEPCTDMSWVGSLEVSEGGEMDGTYGFALSKAEDIPASVFADGWWRWAEYYTIYDGLFERDDEGLIVSCEPGAKLVHAYDTGVGVPDSIFWETGYVIDAAGAFAGLADARTDGTGEFTVFSDEKTTPDGKPFPIGFTLELVIG